MKKASITEKMASAAQSQALAIASQAQTSSTMQASAHHQGKSRLLVLPENRKEKLGYNECAQNFVALNGLIGHLL